MKTRIILIILVLTIGLNSFGQRKKKDEQEPPMGTFVSDAQFKDFIPISPMDFEQEVSIYNKATNSFEKLSIKQLATDKTKIITFLPNETVYSTVEKKDGSAEVKYGPASITAEAGSYTVTLDYAKFTTLKVVLDDGKCAGFTKVGIGMRITAKITTFEAGIDVSSLFGLGIAAKMNKLKGQLSIDIIGMESSQITDLITLPVDISEASVQTALQSLSAIKSKIYDTQTNLYPQILAIKNTNGSCSVFDLLKQIDTDVAKSTKNTSQQQTEQQKQQQLQQQQLQQQQLQQQQQKKN
jgi:hypothetical protein